VLRNAEGGLNLLRLKSEYRKFSKELNQIYESEYKRIFFSELNKIYVALTRPEYELYGFIPKRTANSFNLGQFLIPQEYYESGTRIEYKEEKDEDAVMRDIPPSVYSNWIDYLKDEFQQLSEIKNHTNRLQGEVMHYIFEHIGNLSLVDDVQSVMNQALKNAQRKYPDVEDWKYYKDRLESIIAEEVLKPYFYCGESEVFTEREIVDAHGLTKRFDRLIINDQDAWVVDYKSSNEDQEGNRQQVSEYMEIVRDIYPKLNISGYIIYIDSAEVEQV